MNNLKEHLIEWGALYIAALAFLCFLIFVAHAERNAKQEYIDMCIQSGKSELQCNMRWIEISRD